jgi:hypothetical protein
MLWPEQAKWRQSMLTVLDALLAIAEYLLFAAFGALAWASVYMTAELWVKRETWRIRLAAVLLTCMWAGISMLLWADATRRMVKVVNAIVL